MTFYCAEFRENGTLIRRMQRIINKALICPLSVFQCIVLRIIINLTVNFDEKYYFNRNNIKDFCSSTRTPLERSLSQKFAALSRERHKRVTRMSQSCHENERSMSGKRHTLAIFCVKRVTKGSLALEHLCICFIYNNI